MPLRKNDKMMFHKKHPLYHFGYVYCYKDMAYTCIHGRIRRSTKIPYSESNRSILLTILDKRINQINQPLKKHAEKNVNFLVSQFMTAIYPTMKPDNQRLHTAAFYRWLNPDLLLEDHVQIRQEIYNRNDKVTIVNNTKRKELGYLKRLFNFAIENEYMDKNPILSSMLPKKEKVEVNILDNDDTDRFISYLRGRDKEMSLLVEIICITGMRISEALSLTWDDINEKDILIHGKGGVDRLFPIHTKLFPRLPEVIDEIRNLYLNNKNNRLFHWETRGGCGKVLRTYLKDADLYEMKSCFHQFRKRAENNMIKRLGISTFYAAKILGHTEEIQKQHYLEEVKLEEISMYLDTIAVKI